MAEIGVTLPLSRVYESVEFPSRPRLVIGEEAEPALPPGRRKS